MTANKTIGRRKLYKTKFLMGDGVAVYIALLIISTSKMAFVNVVLVTGENVESQTETPYRDCRPPNGVRLS